MAALGNKIQQNSAHKFYCEFCDYGSSRKYNYDTHINSGRHINQCEKATNGNKIQQNSANIFYCDICEKSYNNRTSLWKHNKKCNKKQNEEISSNELHKQNIELQKKNIELQKQILEICKNLQPSTINNTMNNCHNTNSNNKTFNLHVFLNETCKDAMNITEFIENISLQLSDLENIGKLGYVEGVSNIIIKNLNALEVEKRPMHCTDKKREIIYVKDADEWQKEEEHKKRIRKVISSVVSKNLNLLPEYENKYPEYVNPDSKKSDEYNKIIMETMGGGVNVGEKNKERIIRKIVKEVTIEKE
jgi:hypothetical protein